MLLRSGKTTVQTNIITNRHKKMVRVTKPKSIEIVFTITIGF